jgi:hypothetical protein
VKKLAYLILLLIMVITVVVGIALSFRVNGATGVTVTASDATVAFPASITFSVKASSDQPITDIRLRYTVAERTLVSVVNEAYVVFTPAASVSASWMWDLRQNGGLPPGTGISYWWKVTDAAGRTTESAHASLSFDDQRYTWRSLNEGLVTLSWYNGDSSFGAQLMDAAQTAVAHLKDLSGATLSGPVKIFIYKDAQDLQGALIFAQDWTGGVAFSEYGTVVIGIGTSASELAWGTTTIAHELTHIIVGQVTENPYGGLPTWLNEGLAMVAEGPLDASFTSVFQQAESQHTLISVRSLASPFSVYGDIAYLAYAESDMITDYLLTTYGRDKMLQLLNVFAQGSTYDDALRQVYGFDMDGLNSQWQASIGYGATA